MDLAHTVDSIKNFVKLERVLAVVCALTPLVLIGLDGGARDSISAYYDMTHNQAFYYLLTVAVMLFLTNAFVKHAHMYNAALALFLSGVVLFNYQEYQPWHNIFAGVFFVGSALVIAFFSKGPGARFKIPFLVVLAIVVIGLWRDWYSLLVGEWLAMGVIAIHYWLDATESATWYNAMERGESVSLAA